MDTDEAEASEVVSEAASVVDSEVKESGVEEVSEGKDSDAEEVSEEVSEGSTADSEEADTVVVALKDKQNK